MDSKDITRALMSELNNLGNKPLNNVMINPTCEADVVSIARDSGYITEFEIKTSIDDLKRDFNKEVSLLEGGRIKKHDIIWDSNIDKYNDYPVNKFCFVVTKEVFEDKRFAEIMSNASYKIGVYVAKLVRKTTLEYKELRLVLKKSPRFITKKKFTYAADEIIRKGYCRYIYLYLKYEDYRKSVLSTDDA